MKKWLLTLIIGFIFIGCKKSDWMESFDPEGKTYAALWYTTLNGERAYQLIKFIDKNKVEISTRANGPTGRLLGTPRVYSYELDYPYVIVYMDGSEKEITYTIANRKTFVLSPVGNESMYFYLQ